MKGVARPGSRAKDCLTGPMALMQQGHERQLLLCDALETIADGLPDSVNPDLTRCALTLLRSGVLDDARAQEQALFQALGQHTASTRHLRFVIDRLAADHADDSFAALEIADALRELAEYGCSCDDTLYVASGVTEESAFLSATSRGSPVIFTPIRLLT